jgi:hypothetical protein
MREVGQSTGRAAKSDGQVRDGWLAGVWDSNTPGSNQATRKAPRERSTGMRQDLAEDRVTTAVQTGPLFPGDSVRLSSRGDHPPSATNTPGDLRARPGSGAELRGFRPAISQIRPIRLTV